MTIDELVGENLRRAREAVGVSRRDLAHRVAAIGLPLGEADLERLEAGDAPISVDALVALGLALGVPPGLLLAPLNFGALLCVDGEGRATASWSLFHDWARPFSSPSKPGGLLAAAGEVTPEAPAATPEAPASEPTPTTTLPSPADFPAPPAAVIPDSPPPPDEPAADPAEIQPPATPTPQPVPEQAPPWPLEASPERDWALQALRELHQVR